MSFIYQDSDLIKRLFNSALDFENKFTKQGQEAVANTQQDRANLQAMIKSLQTQLNPDPNVANVSHQGNAGDRPGLTSSNLESLGDLIKFLAANKITVSGKIIAYDTDPNNDDYTLYQLETHLANPNDRGRDPNRFYVNADLLKQYIVYLQSYETQHPNRPMQVQLQNLIAETNQQLGTKISQQYKAPEKVLADTVLLDHVPDQFFTVSSSGYGGDIPLTYGDLKDETTFNKWLNDKSITFKPAPNVAPVSFGNPSYNRCAILNILFARAKNNIARATDATMKENMTIYLRQVEMISSQAQCALTGTTSPQSGAADMQADSQNKGQQGAVTASFDNAVAALPLSEQNIDFNRIRQFFNVVTPLLNTPSQGGTQSVGPQVMKYIENTENLMKQVSSYTANGDTFFQLGITPTALIHMFKNDTKTPAKYFFTVVSALNQIVDNVRVVINYLSSRYPNKDQTGAIYGQIGKRPNDRSIYSSNIDYLNTWLHTPIVEK